MSGIDRLRTRWKAQTLALLESIRQGSSRGAEVLRLLSSRVRDAGLRPYREALVRGVPWAVAGVAATVLLTVAVGYGVATYGMNSLDTLAAAPPDCPSRLYARSLTVQPGARTDLDTIERALQRDRYRRADDRIEAGTYWRTDNRLSVHLRRYPLPSRNGSFDGGERLDLIVEAGTLQRMLLAGETVTEPIQLPPVLLGSAYTDDLVECTPVIASELPAHVVHAVMAAEDGDFFEHPGLSVAGVARAAWVNLVRGELRQGGSTLTQQLAKNLYLTPERSFRRKLREAIFALGLEIRHDKKAILLSYVNHAYWGHRNDVEIIGIGGAAMNWLGKSPADLDVAEAALLAAMIRSPGRYDPERFPDRARGRRDRILAQMRRQGRIDDSTYRKAVARPIRLAPPLDRSRTAPHFTRWAGAEVERRYEIELDGGGYRVLTTLQIADQLAAEDAVRATLRELDPDGSLEAALVSLDSTTGAVRAYVGGRDWQASRFDRASQSRRQLGSAFKPFVYAAALDNDTVRPADVVYDSPLLVAYGKEYWLPRNHDRDFRGAVTVDSALARSLNVPTVRVALATGLVHVRDVAARFGLLEADAEAVPSLALGTLHVSPILVAAAYATFDNEGRMPTAYAVERVLDPSGRKRSASPPPTPKDVLSADSARRMTSMLEGVVRRGTGSRVRHIGVRGAVAGKTGTSDEQRDAWFAGYTPGRATVVWMGRDDDRSTGYYGAQAALPAWSRFVRAAIPARSSWSGSERVGAATGTGEVVSRTGPDPILRPPRQTGRTRYRPSHDRGMRPRNWRARSEWSVRTVSRSVGEAEAAEEDPWARFRRRLDLWRELSVSAGTVRVFEVPESFSLPCVAVGRASVEKSSC